MKSNFLGLFLLLSLSLHAVAQRQSGAKSNTSAQKQKPTKLNMEKITNESVRKAFEALQAGDKSWYSFFTENVKMTDDGRDIDFKRFFAGALGKEKFVSIDKVENDGKDIYGPFKAGSYGTFKVFFKFHQNADGKFDRLDIGQAGY
ncbi:MAG TPA: hypothetical protein VGN64_03770 [Dyadobacter sp.]|jgi:hypothetical protein|nr:hypothetical protein [Dyadobacter sp.]